MTKRKLKSHIKPASDPVSWLPTDEDVCEVDNSVVPGEMVLGDVLRKAREANRLTRKELSDITGIGQNSIVRYEKCGIDEDGQNPPSNVLALLIFELGIKPDVVMIASLPPKLQNEGYAAFKTNTSNPLFRYLKNQYSDLLHEMQIFRSLFKKIFGKKPNKNSSEYKELLELISLAKSMTSTQDDFEKKMVNTDNFIPLSRDYYDPISNDEIVKDWTYVSNAEFEFDDVNQISKLLEWEEHSPSINDILDELKNNQHSNLRISKLDTQIKESSENGLAASPSSQDDK